MYIHNTYIHVRTRTYTYIHVCTCTYTYVHVRTRTYIHVSTRTYTYIQVCTRACTYVQVRTRTYGHVHVCTCVYTYVHMHKHAYTCVHVTTRTSGVCPTTWRCSTAVAARARDQMAAAHARDQMGLLPRCWAAVGPRRHRVARTRGRHLVARARPPFGCAHAPARRCWWCYCTRTPAWRGSCHATRDDRVTGRG